MGGNKMNEKLKKKYGFKFMPGDKVYAIFDRKKVIGVVDTCAISYNPVPKCWVIFEVSQLHSLEHAYGKIQGWYPEVLLKKEG
jgi:hypothetical protein